MHRHPKIFVLIRTRKRCAGGGFTFFELVLGMMVTTLIMAAVAALMTAVGRGWTASSTMRAASNSTMAAGLRLNKALRTAKQIGVVRAGSLDGSATAACVMLWKGDANYDGKVQFSELALIEHSIGSDAAHSQLLLYQVSFPSTWNAAQKQAADSTLADDDIYKSNEPETFKGLTYVTSTAMASNVIGCTFKKVDSTTTNRPGLEYKLQIHRVSGNDTEYGRVSLRCPTTLPSGQTGA